jgi:hypothetical protein
MKAKILSIAVLFALSAAAAAAPPFVVPPPFQGGGDGGSATAISGASSNATAISGASSNATALQGQVQGQKQSTVVGVGVGGQSTSINFEAPPADTSITYGGKVEVKNVPDAVAPSAYPTAPCRIAISGAGSGVGFGLSIGGSVLDEDCNKRELSRSFQNLGQAEAALEILCSHEGAAAASICKSEDAPAPVAFAGPRPTSGFQYDARTGERVCAYDAILADRNKLTVCK